METIKKLLVSVNVLALGKSFYFLLDDNKENYQIDDYIVVETTRGIELGKVASLPIEKDILEDEEYPKVIKKGDLNDYAIYQENIEKAKAATSKAQEEADKLSLDMKIISADYTLDSTKLMICYLSETRVDFRELLKVLAADFKCRIELRQIGTRDKAKMIGGIGICGLKLCCSSFLNEFDGISITMAKNQMLALNIPKLSGHCGKLICCLKFENDTYSELQKELPRIGTRVRYEDNIYKITSMNVITKMIRIENKDNVANVPYDTIKDSLLPRDYPMNQPTPVEAPKKEEKVEVKEEVKAEPKQENKVSQESQNKDDLNKKNFNNNRNNNSQQRHFNNNNNNGSKKNFNNNNNNKRPFNKNNNFKNNHNNQNNKPNQGSNKDAKN